jgi:acyl-coenzyme A thioesterase PaaI-like protein
VEVHLANERAVQNHIGSVHASAMNLLAETATGMVVGMNVRDDCLPLAKSLTMDFRKRVHRCTEGCGHPERQQRKRCTALTRAR